MYHGLLVEKDVSIEVRDGTRLCADVFRPDAGGRVPAIMTLGPYPKDIHFRDWNAEAYERVAEQGPWMHWESVNPEWWVPLGYAVIRVDTRGTGASPGTPRLLSMREAEDFYDAIEWAGTQRWCNGRVAVMGISYFAMNAWRVASLQPPHLAAVVPWEGAADLYRDVNRHGGIRSNSFTQRWSSDVSRRAQGGDEGRPAAAAEELYDERVARNNPDFSQITAPLLSVGNWGGAGLHLRGNVEGFVGAGSAHRQLRLHSADHATPFYSLEGRLEQLRFLEQWLKGVDTGVTREPPVKLAIRLGGDRSRWRYEYEWPIARTQWTEFFLDAASGALEPTRPGGAAQASFDAEPEAERRSVRFATAPADEETEITGPIKLKLWISSSVDDADLFVILRNLDPSGSEVTYPGSNQPEIAAAYGWLRASHRKLDPQRSRPYRPYHTHDELQKLTPGEVVPVEIEVRPASLVLFPGHRLELEIASHDDPRIEPFTHTDPSDRIERGTVTIHTGGSHDAHLLLPVIPPRD